MAMPESVEAQYLREHWNERALRQHMRKWIAVKDRGIIGAHVNLGSLIEETKHYRPLYAFVNLGRIQ